jgi:hypothetical protein
MTAQLAAELRNCAAIARRISEEVPDSADGTALEKISSDGRGVEEP